MKTIKTAKTSLWTLAGMICTLLSVSVGSASSQVLYDGAGNLTPDQAPYNWVFGQVPFTPDLHGTASGGATTLDTTGLNGYSAGYSYVTPFALDNMQGYSVVFDLKVNSETHNGSGADKNGDGLADRSGSSVIVLGSDHKGVELAFWTNEVWTQSDAFLHPTSGTETRTFDTQTAIVHYVLGVTNGSYALSGNGTPLLSGSLHSYAAGPALPYGIADYIFSGDDTTSARANMSLAHVEVTPEPGALACLVGIIVGGAGMTRRARQNCKRRRSLPVSW